jgi:ferredoxin--NADP+ reductase
MVTLPNDRASSPSILANAGMTSGSVLDPGQSAGQRDMRHEAEAAPGPGPCIAIVGAGPSGLFAVQHLRKLVPDARIDVLERLPVPHGLIRYGVAPDHQGTKAVARQFERLFEREGVAFFGNVAVGSDVSIDELSGFYDAVILAVGLYGDRRLGIPGEDLAGVWGSGHITRWLNGHPMAGPGALDLGQRVVVIGSGNVAIDVARVLLKRPDDLAGSDLHPLRLAQLVAQGVQHVSIVARGDAATARFDAAMIKEIGPLSGISVSVEWSAGAAEGLPKEQAARVAALRQVVSGASPSDRHLQFRFGLTPTAFLGHTTLDGVRFKRCDGTLLTIPATSAIKAIGFESEADAPFADVRSATGSLPRKLSENIFTAGWFHLGPNGTIADNRLDARTTAELVVQGLRDRRKAGRAGLQRALKDWHTHVVEYEGWQRIRMAEEQAGAGTVPRVKMLDHDTHMARAAPPQGSQA